MNESFAEILAIGGKSNSLGRASEVIDAVLQDKSRLEELYNCLFTDDAWARMRAADSLEKVCRVHPDWITPYIDRIFDELSTNTHPSILWHIAQILQQVELTDQQKQQAILWLKHILSSADIDWIVSANAMDTLVQFTKDGSVDVKESIKLLKIQQGHKSNAVIKRATKLLMELTNE